MTIEEIERTLNGLHSSPRSSLSTKDRPKREAPVLMKSSREWQRRRRARMSRSSNYSIRTGGNRRRRRGEVTAIYIWGARGVAQGSVILPDAQPRSCEHFASIGRQQ